MCRVLVRVLVLVLVLVRVLAAPLVLVLVLALQRRWSGCAADRLTSHRRKTSV